MEGAMLVEDAENWVGSDDVEGVKRRRGVVAAFSDPAQA